MNLRELKMNKVADKYSKKQRVNAMHISTENRKDVYLWRIDPVAGETAE